MRWAKPAAEAGSPEAQALFAYILTSGPDELRDLDAADDWYRKSAAANCPQGHLGLGLALLRTATDNTAQAAAAEQLKLAADSSLPTSPPSASPTSARRR